MNLILILTSVIGLGFQSAKIGFFVWYTELAGLTPEPSPSCWRFYAHIWKGLLPSSYC